MSAKKDTSITIYNLLAELVKALGNAGISERTDKETLEKGIAHAESIISIVKELRTERIKGVGNDFITDIQLYNALGTIYPHLTRDWKNKAIEAYLKQFDRSNYHYVQNYSTPYIREPLALGDLLVVRGGFYYPGMNEVEPLFTQYKDKDFNKFKENVMTKKGLFNIKKIKSDFMTGYAALRPDMWDCRQQYVETAHPEFLGRVVKGLTNVFLSCKANEFGEQLKKLKWVIPESLHSQIELYYEERDWPDRANYLP